MASVAMRYVVVTSSVVVVVALVEVVKPGIVWVVPAPIAVLVVLALDEEVTLVAVVDDPARVVFVVVPLVLVTPSSPSRMNPK
ncbi:MAG: hypothetical protein A2133_03185 [Actinobacteria bacterium RBG_16_64_13]|nr:MAG: hypothetical protein A2133_03185 [Actinobacteria bacterium RBG_16_64_13]